MPRTYDAILSGNRLRWTGEVPEQKKPVRVQVTILEEVSAPSERGPRMAEALRRLAEVGAFSTVEDPVAWQRQMRQERALPGRTGRGGDAA